jgi:cyclomaltodextrinase / maltogenic alpha-amylase / neopullulanase
MSVIQTPEWVKDAVFYQIFPDRFASSGSRLKPAHLEPWETPPTRHGFKGGDLLGIVERLDYLQDLGINAIYLNPIFQSAANHRYQTHDYYQVDPILGGNRALRKLLNEAHQRGLRVVLDGVFNHCGRGLYQFHHILENGASSPYVDWFSIKGFPLYAYDERQKPNYECWWNLRSLPKFNTQTPAVREFLWGVARHWIERGIDGWRLDVPQEINDPIFWQEFRRRVKEANPEAYLVGEIWRIAPEWLQGDRFDAVTNYPFAGACLKFFVEREVEPELVRGMGYAQGPRLSARQFAATVDNILNSYHLEITQASLNLLDSHDTPRFLTLARSDESALRLATLFQMTYPGTPCLYYGNEIGLEGRRDPDCRRAFPWEDKLWNSSLRDYVKSCIALRQAHPALRRGEYTTFHASDDVYVFGRRLQNETLIVAFNIARSVRTPEIKVAGYLPPGQRLRQVWSDTEVTVGQGMLHDVKLPPRSGVVWVAEAMDNRPEE